MHQSVSQTAVNLNLSAEAKHFDLLIIFNKKSLPETSSNHASVHGTKMYQLDGRLQSDIRRCSSRQDQREQIRCLRVSASKPLVFNCYLQTKLSIV